MKNIVIVCILVIILVPAIRSTAAHMKGEGACCGGPKEKPVKKKLPGRPRTKLIVHIEGMQCDNCRNRVERHLDELDGVIAKVKLSKKIAEVFLYQDVDEKLIKNTIEQLGFHVTGIHTGTLFFSTQTKLSRK